MLPVVCLVGFGLTFVSEKALGAIGLVPLLWFLAGKLTHKFLTYKLRLHVLKRVIPSNTLNVMGGTARPHQLSPLADADDHLREQLLSDGGFIDETNAEEISERESAL